MDTGSRNKEEGHEGKETQEPTNSEGKGQTVKATDLGRQGEQEKATTYMLSRSQKPLCEASKGDSILMYVGTEPPNLQASKGKRNTFKRMARPNTSEPQPSLSQNKKKKRCRSDGDR